MTGFAGQVAWVTGAGTGIGRALAVELAKQGARVLLSGRRQAPLEGTLEQVQAAGGEGLVAVADVTDEESLRAAVAAGVERWGRLDVAIANAGYGVNGRLDDLELAQLRRQLEVNVVGALATVQAALPELKKSRGRVGLVGSVMAFCTLPKSGAYAMSKFAVRAMSNTLRLELAPAGVSVTGLHPGFVESDIAKVDNDNVPHDGRRDPRPAKLMWKAEPAARVMLKALRRRRRELVFTGHGIFVVWLAQHFEWLFYWLLGRLKLGGTRDKR